MRLTSILTGTWISACWLISCQQIPGIPVAESAADLTTMASMSAGVTTEIATPLNNLFTRYGNGWTGGDGVYSIPLPDGRIVWLFGDSFLDTVYADRSRPGSALIRNTMMVQQGKNFTTLVSGTIDDPSAKVDTDDPANEWYWPMDGSVQDGMLKIFYAYYIRTGGGAWDFEYVRTDLVTFSLPSITEVSRTTVWDNTDVWFGAAVMEDADYTYIYGPEPYSITKYMHVARVPADNFSAPWEFWDGENWTDTYAGPSGRLERSGGASVDVSAQFSVFYHEGKYHMVTQEGLLGPNIYTYDGLSPTGRGNKRPWCIPPRNPVRCSPTMPPCIRNSSNRAAPKC